MLEYDRLSSPSIVWQSGTRSKTQFRESSLLTRVLLSEVSYHLDFSSLLPLCGSGTRLPQGIASSQALLRFSTFMSLAQCYLEVKYYLNLSSFLYKIIYRQNYIPSDVWCGFLSLSALVVWCIARAQTDVKSNCAFCSSPPWTNPLIFMYISYLRDFLAKLLTVTGWS